MPCEDELQQGEVRFEALPSPAAVCSAAAACRPRVHQESACEKHRQLHRAERGMLDCESDGESTTVSRKELVEIRTPQSEDKQNVNESEIASLRSEEGTDSG